MIRPTGRTAALAAAASAAVVLLLLAPARARAQPDPTPAPAARDSLAPAGPRLEASAFAGVLAPLARLTADPGTFETEVSSSALFGAEATWWPRRRLGIAAQGAWAPARLSLIPTDFTGALPGDLGDADYLAASAEARYRLPLPPEVSVVRPYLALGGGIRRLDVQAIASPEVADATDPMVTAAAGAHVRMAGRFEARFELRDRITVYDSPRNSQRNATGGAARLQNDLAISVGLALRRF